MTTRESIIDIVRTQLALDDETVALLRQEGRLDAFTALDSLFIVELVMTVEEQFGIRFDPEKIDADLIGNLDRLVAYVDRKTCGPTCRV